MSALIDLLSTSILLLPIGMLLLSFIAVIQKTEVPDEKKEIQPDQINLETMDPTRELTINAFLAKKALAESTRLMFERYRKGDSELRNAPIEVENIAEQIFVAINYLNSDRTTEIVSALQTLSALGTRNLLIVLDDNFESLENRWQHNQRVIHLVKETKQQMSTSLIEKQVVSVTDETLHKPHDNDKEKKSIVVAY